MDQDSVSGGIMLPVTHRYWTGEPHPLAAFIGNAVVANAPGPVLDWSDETLPEGCREAIERNADKVHPLDEIRHRCNIIRWWMLYHHGSYTIHHDLIPLVPFVELPFPVTAAHTDEWRCSSFLAFPKGHEVPAYALEAIDRAPRCETGAAPEVSGERLLDRLAGDIPRLILPHNKWGQPVGGPSWAVFLRFPKERYRQNVDRLSV